MQKQAEVLVAGGGPAGVAAAISAARNGAKVILVERYGFLGGMATAGLVGPFMQTAGAEGGIFREVLERLYELGGCEGFAFDAEILKILLLRMVKEAGVELLLHSFIYDAIVEGNQVKGALIANKLGSSAILSKIAIDASGDGDLSYFAGADFWKGEETSGRLQGVTLMFRIGGVDEDKLPEDIDFLKECTEQARKNGELKLPEYVPYVHLGDRKGSTLRAGERSVNIDMVSGIDGTDPYQLTQAEIWCRERVLELVNFYRKYIPGMENCYLIDTGATVGIRETRRIVGLETVTGEDVRAGRKRPEEAIAICSFPIDLHDPGIYMSADWWKVNRPPDWYDIPYGCLLPKNLDGLLVAGRCISSDREANGSLRIMPTCMATGQATGIAAVLCVQKDIQPKELDVQVLRKLLLEQGAKLG